MTMSYKALQTALKTFREEGRTSIKLNATKVALQEEYDRLTAVTEAVTSEIVITETLTITFHSFKEILRQRKSSFRPKAHGFKIVNEKRYDQLSLTEWLGDTLAFLEDYIIYDEDDYIAA
jgi:hypothetical protein